MGAGDDFGSAKRRRAQTILVSEAMNGFSCLMRCLEAREFRCQLVATYREAAGLLGTGGFNLLIGSAPLPPGTVSLLANLLASRRISFFCVQAVEDGCWWVPIYQRGESCFGAPALRPREFGRFLDMFCGETDVARIELQREQQASLRDEMVSYAHSGRKSEAERRFIP